MEISCIAPERNDKGDCRLDCCVRYVELFVLDWWRCRTMDGTLRRKGLHRLLGSVCFYKQSSEGRKKYLWTITYIASSHFASHLLCVYLDNRSCFSVRVLLWMTMCIAKLFLTHLSFGLLRGKSEITGSKAPTSRRAFPRHSQLFGPHYFPFSSRLLVFLSEILPAVFSHPNCNSL